MGLNFSMASPDSSTKSPTPEQASCSLSSHQLSPKHVFLFREPAPSPRGGCISVMTKGDSLYIPGLSPPSHGSDVLLCCPLH